LGQGERVIIYFTADHHFGHANVIRHCDRPFASAHEMDETLIDNTNAAFFPLICSLPNLLNAGVDINGYRPVSFAELVDNNVRFKEAYGSQR